MTIEQVLDAAADVGVPLDQVAVPADLGAQS